MAKSDITILYKYRPNKLMIGCLPIVLGFVLLFSSMICYSIYTAETLILWKVLKENLILLIPIVGNLLIIIYISNLIKSTIIFESEGIRITKGRSQIAFLKWEYLNYSYSGRNQKGISYIVLSKEILNSNSVNDVVNSLNVLDELCTSSIVIIPSAFMFKREKAIIESIINENLGQNRESTGDSSVPSDKTTG